VEAVGTIPVDVSREAAFVLAVDRHMEILNAIDQFEDSKRRIWVRADQLRPGLNFTARATANSTPNYTEFDASNFNYVFGLSLDLPFNRMRERNDYRATLISFESQLRSLTLTLDRFKQRIDGGLRAPGSGPAEHPQRAGATRHRDAARRDEHHPAGGRPRGSSRRSRSPGRPHFRPKLAHGPDCGLSAGSA
jgi:hypothetical protein